MENNFNANKVGGVICVIGGTGTGKTPFVKKLLAQSNFLNKLVYDPRREYSLDDYTVFYKLKYFKEKVSEARGAAIVVEEATGFISSFKDIELTEWMIASEHNNNFVVFVFHTLMDAPKYVLNKCKFVQLFKTGDEPKDVMLNRARFYDYFMNENKPVTIPIIL